MYQVSKLTCSDATAKLSVPPYSGISSPVVGGVVVTDVVVVVEVVAV